jgi:hypothetical protein
MELHQGEQPAGKTGITPLRPRIALTIDLSASIQDPGDKREIICDEKLRAVFGVSKINMFKMNKVLSQCVYTFSLSPVPFSFPDR